MRVRLRVISCDGVQLQAHAGIRMKCDKVIHMQNLSLALLTMSPGQVQ